MSYSLFKIQKLDYPSIVKFYEKEINLVEESLKKHLYQPNIPYFQQHSFLTGKKIRPLLVFMSQKLIGSTKNPYIKLASCIELIHYATLLHDDVIDNSQERRKQKSLNAKWGNQVSILMGDYLFTEAFDIIINIKNHSLQKELCKSCHNIVQGELLHLYYQKDFTKLSKIYFDILTAKTAHLFAISCAGPAYLENPDKKDKLYKLGMNIGIIYQILDDYSDYFLSSTELGKKQGLDFFEHKVTFPIIEFLKVSSAKDKSEFFKIWEKKDKSQKDFFMVCQLLTSYNIQKICKEFISPYIKETNKIIDSFLPSPTKNKFYDLLKLIITY